MSVARPTTVARRVAEAVSRRLAPSATPGPVVGTARAVAFWVAALTPLTYLPLLAAGVVADNPAGFLALVGANAAAFVLGHDHNR